jgi:glycerol uptake facilitator-like aquaporin
VNAAGRRLLAEFTGTGLLVAVVVGSGIAATRLTTGKVQAADVVITMGCGDACLLNPGQACGTASTRGN